jgi:predicted RNA binding protein YcfA (HicA-like mRNA interferase family)
MPSAQKIVEWLEQHDALQLGEEPPAKPLGDDEELYLIDWKRLFPSRRPGRDGDWDWDLYGDDWSVQQTAGLDDDARFAQEVEVCLGKGELSEEETKAISLKLGWDTCAWYQPIHFFGYDWGIFIRRDCIRENAKYIARFLRPGTRLTPNLLKALVRAGFSALFLHEQFHHKVESLGIRLHVVEKASRYLPYKKQVYRRTYGTNDNMEEALANADAFLRADTSPYSTWMGDTVVTALQSYMALRFPFDPPGYNQAVKYLTRTKCDRGIDLLHGQVQEGQLKPCRPSSDWEVATRLHQSMFKVTDHLWEIVPKGKRPMLPTLAVPYKSISTDELVRLAKAKGWIIKEGAGKGSHIRMENGQFSSLTIPGNRRDLSPGVVKDTLKKIGNYKLRDLPELIRGRI